MTTLQFTVFTPTYNRAHTLHRVYDSLSAQTFRDFEWLIVDDGSTDNTRDLVAQWRRDAPFAIRYIYQENKGKHIASNLGVREANGELFLFFDSDDACVPEALERFAFHWNSMSDEEKSRFSTISGLCENSSGQLIGKPFRADIIDGTTAWRQAVLRSAGDLWGVNRTDILRRFPFPEIEGETFIPEGIVWNRIAHEYHARFINERLKLVEYRLDGLSASSIQIRAGSPIGTRSYYLELSALASPAMRRAKALVNYIRFSFHGQIPLRQIITDSTSLVATVVLLPFGYVLYQRDKRS